MIDLRRLKKGISVCTVIRIWKFYSMQSAYQKASGVCMFVWLINIRSSLIGRVRGVTWLRFRRFIFYESSVSLSVLTYQIFSQYGLFMDSSDHHFRSFCYTQKNLFEFLLNQTEIRLYLSFSDWFETKRTSVWNIYWRGYFSTEHCS